MMDQEKFMLLLKCFAALVIIILLFTVVIPKYKQIDAFITSKTEEFLGMIFRTSATVWKRSNQYGDQRWT